MKFCVPTINQRTGRSLLEMRQEERDTPQLIRCASPVFANSSWSDCRGVYTTAARCLGAPARSDPGQAALLCSLSLVTHSLLQSLWRRGPMTWRPAWLTAPLDTLKAASHWTRFACLRWASRPCIPAAECHPLQESCPPAMRVSSDVCDGIDADGCTTHPIMMDALVEPPPSMLSAVAPACPPLPTTPLHAVHAGLHAVQMYRNDKQVTRHAQPSQRHHAYDGGVSGRGYPVADCAHGQPPRPQGRRAYQHRGGVSC